MASTRSSTESRETPRGALLAVARQTLRIQIAALSAAGKALEGWVQTADRLAVGVGDELLRRVDGETDSRELIVGIASATNSHLQDLTKLPRAAADHFSARLDH
jgi:hypothetical protein